MTRGMEMIRLLWVALLLAVSVGASAQPTCIVVKAGDADDFLKAVDAANRQNESKDAPRFYILVPDGIYDLGKRVLTTVTGHNVSIVGQSMERTVIVNAPESKDEGISKTATLRNRGTGLHLQDLTLQNALKYYESGFAGRAVCLQDKGTRTICKRVRMLSYQDTYYSDNDGAFYFEDSEIHGTVDFICGAGDVFFNRCTIVTEKRSADGKGVCVIAAPRTAGTQWGYIFESCRVKNVESAFRWARAWKDTPHCIWLRTTLETPEKLVASRFDERGMGTCRADFCEYMTMDGEGRDITPHSNVLTFTLKDESHTQETVLTRQQAKRYQLKRVFPEWRPEKALRKLQKEADRLWNEHHQK